MHMMITCLHMYVGKVYTSKQRVYFDKKKFYNGACLLIGNSWNWYCVIWLLLLLGGHFHVCVWRGQFRLFLMQIKSARQIGARWAKSEERREATKSRRDSARNLLCKLKPLLLCTATVFCTLKQNTNSYSDSCLQWIVANPFIYSAFPELTTYWTDFLQAIQA